MDGRVSARELDTTHWAADRNSNDNHGLVQRSVEEKTLRYFVRSQFLLVLEQAEGYVKTPGKSTFPSSTVRGFWKQCLVLLGLPTASR
jgi:hypothetical protein